ncbi:dihydroxyacetone kinase subunit DhaK [Photobacterium proteolyticum]|uniref:phosphoenolpyruvate--glycerone phosphotransferase n=1 Tax=Photobacterium proteolyticum TaxID=1903952 RepID=A0A1Q9GIS4_9GAMM|nr:dihydroxyacetone kinase subunit DhaK [Photobacterium proteolyticum]OLQ74357.1 dihydroxyacetone kinase subunit DhaK [Photobacterium proteolyticum]
MKKMINHVDNVVKEQLEGMAKAYPELTINLAPYYIYRASQGRPKVALISGGGSGHEPMHGGFVGYGMLDAACPGEIFTSPTPDQMYECGRQVDRGEGVLFLVKNYTGDVMNFEAAVELLHADGINVQATLIDDDVAVKDSLYTAGRRGVAATVLAEKILGAATEVGYTLEQCCELAKRIANQARSIGVALSACTVPAAGQPGFQLADNEVEFGIGIHGEPGIKKVPYSDCDTTTSDMMAQLLDNTPYQRTVRRWDSNNGDWQDEQWVTATIEQGDKVIVLVNSLGGTPLSELFAVYRKAEEVLAQAGITIERRLIGSYCTSLDMQGVSITLLKIDDEMLTLWDQPVNTPALRWGL